VHEEPLVVLIGKERRQPGELFRVIRFEQEDRTTLQKQFATTCEHFGFVPLDIDLDKANVFVGEMVKRGRSHLPVDRRRDVKWRKAPQGDRGVPTLDRYAERLPSRSIGERFR